MSQVKITVFDDGNDVYKKYVNRWIITGSKFHGSKVELTNVAEKEIKITVRDEGPGFDPISLDDPRADEKKTLERGRGIFIIKSYMDELHYNEQGNTLTIIKAL